MSSFSPSLEVGHGWRITCLFSWLTEELLVFMLTSGSLLACDVVWPLCSHPWHLTGSHCNRLQLKKYLVYSAMAPAAHGLTCSWFWSWWYLAASSIKRRIFKCPLRTFLPNLWALALWFLVGSPSHKLLGSWGTWLMPLLSFTSFSKSTAKLESLSFPTRAL